MLTADETSRDHARTPMHWSGGPNAGFTTGAKPWLAVNPNYVSINAEAALADPDSIYRHYQRLLKLRRTSPALIYGTYRDLDPAHEWLFVFERQLGDERVLVVLNFGGDEQSWRLPEGMAAQALLLGNLPDRTVTEGARELQLAPWEALVVRLKVR